MAEATVSDTESLKAFLSAHTGTLYDVVALLDAAAERIDFATPTTDVSPEGADTMHNTLRLVQMATEKVKSLADLMFAKG